MEKISNIVRGNARVAASDLKSSGAVRPGALSFGRPIGESSHGVENKLYNAERAKVVQAGMMEARRANTKERLVADMADSFFMSRVRRPEDTVMAPVPNFTASAQAEAEDAIGELAGAQREGVDEAQPQGYVPRGSYVNVRA